MVTKNLKYKLQNSGSILGTDAKQTKDGKPGIVISFAQVDSPAEGVELTEDGIAEDFAHSYGHDLKFDHDREKWFVWSHTHWKMNKAKLVVDFIRRHARLRRGGNTRLARKNAVLGVEQLARSDPRFAVLMRKIGFTEP